MSGRKSVPERGAAPDVSAPPLARKKQQGEGMRETVEAVAIAFILAFLFKTFQAELYVIPTGSMAPTLYGRHKDVTCSGCGYRYTVGASQEVDQESGVVLMRLENSECPNCRHLNSIRDASVFNGDRILVNKPVGEYRRFDVVVFRNPEEPHVNYIKRCVGLPGETIRIRQGDLYGRKATSEPWAILRKDDPQKQKSIQLDVYDDRFPPRELIDAGVPERWMPSSADEAVVQAARDKSDRDKESLLRWVPTENAWRGDRDARTYTVDASDNKLHWLRYRHILTPRAWDSGKAALPVDAAQEPSLIVDTCGFNSSPEMPNRDYDDGLFWVGDLTINAVVDVKSVSSGAKVAFELVEGARDYRCEISPENGQVEIFVRDRSMDGQPVEPQPAATADSTMVGVGRYVVSFANVDERLCLWINDSLVPLGEGVLFERIEPTEPTEYDLSPVGIAASNLQATISDLVIQRDIYYRNDTIDFRPEYGTTGPANRDVRYVEEVPGHESYGLATLVRDPPRYAQRYFELTNRQSERYGDISDYVLADDEFLMFGDNSPASKDSRLFDYYTRPMQGRGGHRYAVQRQDLIGEALVIFWPHAIPFLNGGQGYSILNHREHSGGGAVARGNYPMYRFPFYPNVSRMKKIR